MNRLSTAQRVAVTKALVEGNSIRSTVRLTGVAKNTVTKLLVELGAAVADYQDKTLRNLPCKRVQVDEIWSFCYAKERAIRQNSAILERNPDAGDVWTFTGICSDTKLCVSFLVGDRTAANAFSIMDDIRNRMSDRIQLTTDQLTIYMKSVEKAFGADVDYGMLHKEYKGQDGAGRYSPAICIGCTRKAVIGDPDPKHISTSHVERVNLSMRMGMRRFTRLTNGFSKKLTNHMAAIALYFMWYNFGRIHQTLRVTPAMEAGVAEHVWTVEEIVGLLEGTAKI